MKTKSIIISLLILLLLFQFLTHPTIACKDIIACGDATEGDYNLLLKVRDPSRPGYQVLHIIQKGYEYSYHQPWTGLPVQNTVSHKYIGITSKEDIPPAIFKPGMCLTDAGIAYGDADSLSGWINPTKHAWDDFDWIRYSCEQADSTEEAAYLLTKKAVDQLHAPGVSENLFVAGPDHGYVIEADAYRYHINKITNGVDTYSNYPRELWKTQWKQTRLIASSFEAENQKTIGKGGTIRLGSLYGIRVKQIGSDFIKSKQVPFFSDITYKNGRMKLFTPAVTINLGERKSIGDFSVTLLEINEGKATIHLEPRVKAWYDEMMNIINSAYGKINVQTMMKWSRLQKDDLHGLRGMCQTHFQYEGSAIYKIPKQHYTMLSGGWFAANHATASIFVPFHICNTKIHEPYATGEAAELCNKLSEKYGSRLIPTIEKIETVFRAENTLTEAWANNNLYRSQHVEAIITLSDIFMQKQAWLMQQLFSKIGSFTNQNQHHYLESVSTMWNNTYADTIPNIKKTLLQLPTDPDSTLIRDDIESIVLCIAEAHLEKCRVTGKEIGPAELFFQQAHQLIDNQQYEQGFEYLNTTIQISELLFATEEIQNEYLKIN